MSAKSYNIKAYSQNNPKKRTYNEYSSGQSNCPGQENVSPCLAGLSPIADIGKAYKQRKLDNLMDSGGGSAQDFIELSQKNNRQKKRIAFQFVSSEKKRKSLAEEERKAKIEQGADITNHNIIEKKRKKINKVLRAMKSRPRTKDLQGNNVKQHFGLWKYFTNTETSEKQKFYISLDCKRYEGKLAL